MQTAWFGQVQKSDQPSLHCDFLLGISKRHSELVQFMTTGERAIWLHLESRAHWGAAFLYVNVSYRPILLKNSILRATPKFMKNFFRSCAHLLAWISRTKLRQEMLSRQLHYLLVSTMRNRPQIANERSTIFRIEFFNRIRRERAVGVFR